jgi:hypothetical protein
MVLLDLVQQGSIADFKQPRRGFTVPAGFLKSRRDRGSFCLKPDTLNQGFE